MSRPLAVAWDVDGTLVDSEPLHLEALQATCREHGVDISDYGPAPFVGVAIADVWQALAPRFAARLGEDPVAAGRVFRNAVTGHYLARVDTLRVLPGALEALEHLARRGVALAAVSNSDRAIVEANLRAMGAQQFFGATVSLDDVLRPKPAPEPYLRALAALGVPAQAAWAVEDSATGARSARAAGLRVLVVGGAQPAEGDHRLPGLAGFARWWEAQGAAAPGAVDIDRRLAANGVNG